MQLGRSYRYCREVARSRAKNFYYAFRLLDESRRDSLCSIYAFMRHCDDLSDEEGASLASLEDWRGQMVRALAGEVDSHAVWPAFVDTAKRYKIPHQYFHDMIDGVSSDLGRRRIETFDELYRYCYQVASVAGLSLVHIFGFDRPEALILAEKCGIAFQITNILRDVREDALLGRTYLPAEDLRRFGVTEDLLRSGEETPEFRALMQFEAQRAWGYYNDSKPLTGMVDPSCRKSLAALIEIYSKLLRRIEMRDFAVLRQRVRLSSAEKSWILVRHLLWSSS
ncbi:MAG: phytoene/squalene synthase family protein [Bryobacterales bacterium]|nr:phytoene/squalene synthase family protein [Bryobacterales bacterium]